MRLHRNRLAAALLSLVLQDGCSLCGNEDDVRVASPDGRHVAHSYLRSCGATTDYITMVDLEVPGYSQAAMAYSADGAHDLTLRWASAQELHIECRGCPPRHPNSSTDRRRYDYGHQRSPR